VCRLTRCFLLQSIALSSQHKDVRVVDAPVDDRHRDGVIVEELASVSEVLVGPGSALSIARCSPFNTNAARFVFLGACPRIAVSIS
jgi:hypothetical protein